MSDINDLLAELGEIYRQEEAANRGEAARQAVSDGE